MTYITYSQKEYISYILFSKNREKSRVMLMLISIQFFYQNCVKLWEKKFMNSSLALFKVHWLHGSYNFRAKKKIRGVSKQLTIFAKTSILDVWQDPKNRPLKLISRYVHKAPVRRYLELFLYLCVIFTYSFL